MEDKLLEFFNSVLCHGFKSIVALGLVGQVELNFYTLLDEASYQSFSIVRAQVKGRCALARRVAHLRKGRRTSYNAHLLFQRNERRASSTRVSNTRKRETHVLGAHLALGPLH
jgi:hypothetical protein